MFGFEFNKNTLKQNEREKQMKREMCRAQSLISQFLSHTHRTEVYMVDLGRRKKIICFIRLTDKKY